MKFLKKLFKKENDLLNIDKVLMEEKEIAESVKKKERPDDEFNVLIMPTSIFSRGKLSISTYEYGATNGSYITQMEPVAKYLGKTVGLDQIILLTTKETVNNKVKIKNLGLESYPKKEVTAVEFLKDRLECVFKEERDNNFIEIGTEDENGAFGNEKTIFDLFSELEKNKGEVNVYMDIHGGYRDNQIVLSGIMSLLKDDERLHLKNVYSLHFNNGKGAIVDCRDKLEIFNFTSGMSEFVKYGSASAFETFNINKAHSQTEKEFIELLNDISDAISLCNMNAFDSLLVKLKENKERFLRDLNGTYYGVFLTRLIDQYKVFTNGIEYDLLQYAGQPWNINKFVSQVSWCLNEGMLQQGLTIIESKTGNVLENEGVIYSSKDYNSILDKLGVKPEFKSNEKKSNKKTTASDYFTLWVNNALQNVFPGYMLYNSLLTANEKYKSILKINNNNSVKGNYNNTCVCVINKLMIKGDGLMSFTESDSKKKEKLPIPFKIDPSISDSSILEKIYVFGFLFKQIKLARNNVNHASENNKMSVNGLKALCDMEVYALIDLINKYHEQ